MNVVCQTGPCKTTLSSQCVYYMGENLIYTGINTNDSVQQALQKLNTFLENTLPNIGSEQISFEKEVFQIAHGLSIGDAIRHDGVQWLKAQADILPNSGTVAVVSDVFSTNNFTYQFGGLLTVGGPWVDGTSYFLSKGVAGAIVPEESYSDGEVREFIGTGTPDGLLIELDLGDLFKSDVIGGGVAETNSITNYRSSYETVDGKIYAGYYFNSVITITRTIDGILENAIGLTNLETDWTNRLSLTYV